jgi:hypothetical protein
MYCSKETLCSKQNYWGRRMWKRKPASYRIRSGVLLQQHNGFRVFGGDYRARVRDNVEGDLLSQGDISDGV